MSQAVQTLDDMVRRQLGELLFAERRIEMLLPQLAEGTSDAELVGTLERHLDDTRAHVQNVEEALQALGEHPEARRSPAVEGLERELEHDVEEIAPHLRDLFYATRAMRLEHYEIAAYSSLYAVAGALGEKKALRLARRSLEDEEHALRALGQTAERLARNAAHEATAA